MLYWLYSWQIVTFCSMSLCLNNGVLCLIVFSVSFDQIFKLLIIVACIAMCFVEKLFSCVNEFKSVPHLFQADLVYLLHADVFKISGVEFSAECELWITLHSSIYSHPAWLAPFVEDLVFLLVSMSGFIREIRYPYLCELIPRFQFYSFDHCVSFYFITMF